MKISKSALITYSMLLLNCNFDVIKKDAVGTYAFQEYHGKLYKLNTATGEVSVVDTSKKNDISVEGVFKTGEKSKYNQVKKNSSGDWVGKRKTDGNWELADTTEVENFLSGRNVTQRGDIEDGYKYLGGNLSDSASWEPIKSILDTMKWKPGVEKMIGKYPAKKLYPWDKGITDHIVKRDMTGKLIQVK